MLPVILKACFTVLLLATTLLSSTLPLTLRACVHGSDHNKKKRLYLVVIGLLSCFGGGVFVGTCLMDLIPDAHEKVISGFDKLGVEIDGYPLSEFMICFGFILILASEQIGVWFEEAHHKPEPPVHKPSILSRRKITFSIRASTKESTAVNPQWGMTNTEPELMSVRPAVGELHDCCSFHCPADAEIGMSMTPAASEVGAMVIPKEEPHDDCTFPRRKSNTIPVIIDRNGFDVAVQKRHHLNSIANTNASTDPPRKRSISYGSVISEGDVTSIGSSRKRGKSEGDDLHFDPEGGSSFRAILLVGALSLHSLFEGMALGLQDSSTSITSIFVAIIIHKSIIGFSIGLRLSRSNLSNTVVIICDAIFSVMSPVGSMAGILLSDQLSGGTGDLVNGMLTSVACGTFLYVTFFEIIPHELKNTGRRMAKLLALVLGFAVVALLMFFTN